MYTTVIAGKTLNTQAPEVNYQVVQQQNLQEEDRLGPIRRKKKDSTQVASCYETEEGWIGRLCRALMFINIL